jgi:ectoine hydroxylase
MLIVKLMYMNLSEEQIKSYHENGFLIVENVFTKHEVDAMLLEMTTVIDEDCPRRILEKSGAVRSFFAPELGSSLFREMIRSPKILAPSLQLIGTNVYVHQTKLNSKHALIGDWWEWHQDFTFWNLDDGMPKPEVLTAMIFLNDANEFNGPMLLIPGSHKQGTMKTIDRAGEQNDANNWFKKYQQSTFYMSALTTDLKYTLQKENIRHWAEARGIVAAKGHAGSVLFFHGNVFHASSNNLSPWDRHAFLITYNSVNNTLHKVPNPRPPFLANRDFSPIKVL